MKIGDRVCVKGYVDEIRKDTVIIRNDGGYFGTVPSEVFQPVKDYGTGYKAGKIDAIENVLVIIDDQEQEWGYNNGKIVSERIRARVKALAEGAK